MSPTPEGATEPPPADRDEYSAHELIVTAAIFIILELVFALVKLWMKHRQRTGRGLDDWFIWPALVVNIALCIEGLSTCSPTTCFFTFYLSCIIEDKDPDQCI